MRRLLGAFLAIFVAGSTISPAWAAEKTPLIVLVAANAKAAFGDVASVYEKSHPGISIAATFAGSKVITAQIEQGAAADVIIVSTPSLSTVGSTIDDVHGLFANHVAIAVSKGAAGKIHSPSDLVKPGVRLVGGTPNSVTAAFGDEAIAKLAAKLGADYTRRFNENIVVRKTDTAKVAAALADGSADAGFLFAADIDLKTLISIPLPAYAQVTVGYSVASVKASTHGGAAKEFVRYLTSPDGIAVFTKHGHDAK